jgi:hypothetical protein
MTAGLTSPLGPGRTIETLLALAALEPDEPPVETASHFTSAPAAHVPGSDWPPEQW